MEIAKRFVSTLCHRADHIDHYPSDGLTTNKPASDHTDEQLPNRWFLLTSSWSKEVNGYSSKMHSLLHVMHYPSATFNWYPSHFIFESMLVILLFSKIKGQFSTALCAFSLEHWGYTFCMMLYGHYYVLPFNFYKSYVVFHFPKFILLRSLPNSVSPFNVRIL